LFMKLLFFGWIPGTHLLLIIVVIVGFESNIRKGV